MSHLFRSILLEKAKCYIFFLPTKADEDIGVAVYWGGGSNEEQNQQKMVSNQTVTFEK